MGRHLNGKLARASCRSRLVLGVPPSRALGPTKERAGKRTQTGERQRKKQRGGHPDHAAATTTTMLLQLGRRKRASDVYIKTCTASELKFGSPGSTPLPEPSQLASGGTWNLDPGAPAT